MLQPAAHRSFILSAILFGGCLLLAACRPQNPPSPATIPTPPPAAAPTAGPTLDPETSFAVMTALGPSLRQDALRHTQGVAYVAFPAVSSGEPITRTLPLPGSPVLDALPAYLPTQTGAVEIAIPIGFDDKGAYRYFNTSLSPEAAAGYTRALALDEVRRRFPRGQTLDLTIFTYVSLQGVDWSACLQEASDERMLAGCRLAAAYHPNYPEVERLFISRILAEPAWLPVGWWLSPPSDDRQIPLP